MTVEEILNSDPFSLALRITHPDDLVAEQKLFAELVAGARRSYRSRSDSCGRTAPSAGALLTFSAIFEDPADPATPVGRAPVRGAPGRRHHRAEDAGGNARSAAKRSSGTRRSVDGIGRLAAGVAHDFNNLLTVIMGHGEVLRRQRRQRRGACRPRRDLHENLEAILSASERAASLTAQLLAYGRREPVAPRTFVLSDAVESAAATAGAHPRVERRGRAVADRDGFHLRRRGSDRSGRDEPRAERARCALRGRSHPARDAGRRDDGTRATRVRRVGGARRLRHGPRHEPRGSGADVRAVLHDARQTVRARKGPGSGSRRCSGSWRRSAGASTSRARPGEGTTVTVFFPRVASAPKEVEQSPGACSGRAAAPNSQRVLVVEDEPSVRSLIANRAPRRALPGDGGARRRRGAAIHRSASESHSISS